MSYEDKIKEQARPYLQPGERVLAAFIARPRGATTAAAGGLAGGIIGGRQVVQQKRAAQDAGLQLASPMALTLTGRRLLVLRVSPPIAMGKGGEAPAGRQGRDRQCPRHVVQAGGRQRGERQGPGR
jgi:hypothetical protein